MTPPDGIDLDLKQRRVWLSSSTGTAVLLLVLFLGLALVAVVYYVRDGLQQAQAAEVSRWRTIRGDRVTAAHEHALLGYDRRRDMCIALMDPAEKKRVQQEWNIGGDPLQVHCPWLGQPPVREPAA